ncbi:cytosine permease [Amycolatopsis rhabdoformis]|uniref:Cytosine permease n=1 Tax=Amycolatopsis rhabdoformis TaxID=1448059 RepID=A0ABZ1IES6_9PSEU|nr:cytosine permease [Amycolatopsis rhabdoformis]WSE32653.1 cytosine permease [Amycolatopsis rhabdoformis]
MSSAGSDDYSLARVPLTARRSWFGIAVQRFGQLSALIQFLIGATLGYSMHFWTAFWALTLGALVIELVSVLVGVIAVREGLPTALLARWTGFGTGGAAVLSLVLGLSITLGFGVQSGVSAQGLVSLLGGLPLWAWALVFGLVVTGIVVYGMTSMAWTAYLAVPVFLALVAWSVGTELSRHSLSELVASPPPGPAMTLAQGAALVAGSFITGAVITPDMARFNRSVGDVVKQTVVGITLGEYVIGLAGVLLAHAAGSSDVIAIIVSSVGWIGVLVILLGTVKINDWNLYSASLALVSFVEIIFRRKVHRAAVTIAVGVVGSVTAAFGALDWFTAYASALGYLFPPVAGIMLAEYFVVRSARPLLDRGRATDELPPEAPRWVPATLVVWVLASLAGALLDFGSPAITALVVAFVLYVVAGKAGLVRRQVAPAEPGPGPREGAPADFRGEHTGS